MCEPGSLEIRAPRETDLRDHWECRAAQISAKANVDIPALELTGVELPGVIEDGMPGRGAADKAESLAGCKSPYRQLPVFGRLAYPVVATSEDWCVQQETDLPGQESGAL
jgi:hypothetical protein